jgi:hypothetical protein
MKLKILAQEIIGSLLVYQFADVMTRVMHRRVLVKTGCGGKGQPDKEMSLKVLVIRNPY